MRSDDPTKPFTKDGDSGALVTGIEDQVAYAVHMSVDPYEHNEETFIGSFMCRLDTSLQLLAYQCRRNLDLVKARPPPSPSAINLLL